jgi:peroxiredoxin
MLTFITSLFLTTGLFADGLKVGDKAPKFDLENVDGSIVALDDYTDKKGVIVIFTCNHCPYSIAYEDRIIALDKKYAAKGYPVVAINPNDPAAQPADSFDEMKKRAKDKNFPFPYLFDDGQGVYPKYGATRTPHVFLLQNTGNVFEVAYIGAIDDNYQDADAVEEQFLEDAIEALLAGNKPNPDFTKAIGCTIKVQK